eukprot:1136816-Pelagomonas_calceolata.AAC.3
MEENNGSFEPMCLIFLSLSRGSSLCQRSLLLIFSAMYFQESFPGLQLAKMKTDFICSSFKSTPDASTLHTMGASIEQGVFMGKKAAYHGCKITMIMGVNTVHHEHRTDCDRCPTDPHQHGLISTVSLDEASNPIKVLLHFVPHSTLRGRLF